MTIPRAMVLLPLLLTPLALAQPQPGRVDTLRNVHPRGTLVNSRLACERGDRKAHVAFLGGSITEMNGYRPMVQADLKRRFPDTTFTFTDAGVSSTCSTTGAFRLGAEVLAQGPVDLLFVEFAVNDDQDAAHTRAECVRGLEGIVRQLRRHNPAADVVVTYFVNPEMLATLQKGEQPLTMAAHEEVARHYDLPTIHLAQEVATQITDGQLTWKDFGGVHPAPRGNAIAARMISALLDHLWQHPLPETAKKTPYPLPAPLDPLSYSNARFIDPATAKPDAKWALGTPDWKSIKGSMRDRFAKLPLLCATEPGATLTLTFDGTAAGAYVLAGPDAAILEVSVDNASPREINLYHRFSQSLHYPRTVMLATDLKEGRHTLTIRISPKTTSAGHAARILQFTAN